MSRIYVVVLSLFLAACAGPKQTTNLPNGVSDARAPQKATTVLVEVNGMAPKKAYKEVAQVLQAEGYALANTSSTLLSITTGKKSADPNGILVGLPKHRFSVSIQDDPTTVRFTGTIYAQGTQSEIRKYGQTDSQLRLAWARMVTVASKVADQTNGELAYEK